MNTTRHAASAVLLCVALSLTAGCGSNGAKPAAVGSASAPAASTSAAASASSPGTTPAASGSGALGGLSADAILAKATADTKAVSSVHVTGTGGTGGSEQLDILIASGQSCRASIKSGSSTVGLVQVGGVNWLLLDAATVKTIAGGGAAAKALVGKYVKVTSKDPSLADLANLCNLPKALDSEVTHTTGLSLGPSTTVDGIKAVTLKSTTGETVLVSDTANPLILRVVTSGSDGGSVNFGDYNKVAAITAPPASQTISVPGL